MHARGLSSVSEEALDQRACSSSRLRAKDFLFILRPLEMMIVEPFRLEIAPITKGLKSAPLYGGQALWGLGTAKPFCV